MPQGSELLRKKNVKVNLQSYYIFFNKYLIECAQNIHDPLRDLEEDSQEKTCKL